MKESFTNYGKKGYNLVWAQGFEYQDAALEVAQEYPKTIFVTNGGSNVAKKLSPVITKVEDPAYLAGIVTAMISKTGKAGLVGGMLIFLLFLRFSEDLN